MWPDFLNTACMPLPSNVVACCAVADRMQHAVYDLLGVQADGGDTRPWMRHGG